MGEARNTVNVPVAGSPRFEIEAVQAIGRLKAALASPDCLPQFGNITLTDLTANALVATDDDKALKSATIGNSLQWSSSQLDVIQDVRTSASPTFADLILGDWQLGTPTYNSAHDWMNNVQSAGRITGGGFTDNGDGTLTVAAGTGLIKTTDSRTGVTLMFDWAEDADVQTDAEPPVALTDGATNYIYVDYNSGAPAVYSTTTKSDINFTTKIGLGRVFRTGTSLHMLPGGAPTNDLSHRTHQALAACEGFRRCGGLATSEVGDLSIAITEGTVWNGLRDFAVFTGTGYNSTVTDFTLWHNDGAWQSSATGALTHNYNNYGVGLVAVGSQHYGNFWVYLHHDGHVHVVYGVDTYKYAEAIAAPSPANLPAIVSDFSILIARITIKKEETTTFTTVTTPWESTIISGTVTDHDSLANLAFGDSGHTGFQAQGDILDDFNTLGAVASDGQMVVGTGSGVFAYESGATLRTSIGVDASGTAAGLVSDHETTYNHANYNTAYDHSQLVAGNPHSVTPTELSLVIGTNTQAWDTQLDDIAALAVTNGKFIVGDGANWVAESGNTARTSLELGTGNSPTFAGLTSTGEVLIQQNETQLSVTGQVASNADYIDASFRLRRSRGTLASPLVVQNGDDLGTFIWRGWDGSNWETAADIRCVVDGTPADDTTDMPGKLIFATTPDGTDAAVDRLVIRHDGKIGMNVGFPNEQLEVGGKIRANTAFNLNGTDGLGGTLTLDDGANWRVTLTFSGGILTGQTTGASSAAAATWV